MFCRKVIIDKNEYRNLKNWAMIILKVFNRLLSFNYNLFNKYKSNILFKIFFLFFKYNHKKIKIIIY